jgi:hypothetical protein
MRYLIALALAVTSPAWAQYKCPGGVFQQQPCEGGEKLNLQKAPPSDGRENIRAFMAKGWASEGMTRAEVVRVWGRPATSNRSSYEGRWSEQMVYRWPDKTVYLYLRDDVVTSFSEHKHENR